MQAADVAHGAYNAASGCNQVHSPRPASHSRFHLNVSPRCRTRSAKPLDVQRLEFAGGDLWFALVNPLFEAPTAEMRAALPKQVPTASWIHNAAMGGSLVRNAR